MPSVDSVLADSFPEYNTTDPDPIWIEIKARFQCGDSVTGKIVASFPFGLAIDFGVRFPGMLLATRIPNVNREILRDGPAYQIGQPIEAWIYRFPEDLRQIALTQLEQDTGRS